MALTQAHSNIRVNRFITELQDQQSSKSCLYPNIRYISYRPFAFMDLILQNEVLSAHRQNQKQSD